MWVGLATPKLGSVERSEGGSGKPRVFEDHAFVRTSAASRHRQAAAGDLGAGPAPLPLGSCHVWAADGPGVQKIEAGWVPGSFSFPVPPVAHFT